jgi:predicted ATPase
MALRPGAKSSLPQTSPPAARRPIGNLPAELTTFVGRTTELSAVKHMLTSSRLVTLTGVGGVGKTRLALRAAAEVASTFPDGGWLVELGELHDGSVLADVVAEGLGLRDDPSRCLGDLLVEYLCARSLLLVLDNCEQVVDGTAKLAEALLRSCPSLRILATSRENLGIGGEAVLHVSPLAFPDADKEPTLGGLPGFDAIALFASRAAEAVPGFELTDQNKSTVAHICSRLEGLPLAIELAAARLRAISPDQMLDRLSDRYSLLTRGSRGAPKRQQTLSWSVGWSYDLCTPDEQRLWARLSVFARSFELQAAEDICGGDLAPEDVLDLLSSLVDKSILIRTDIEGVVRYRMLETLREFGLDRIEHAGELTELRRRHAEWYRQLINDAEADWMSPRQVEWMKRLEREGRNIRAALEFSLAESPDTALDIAGALHPFGIARGVLTETRHWLDRTLAATAPAPTKQRMRALYGAAMIAALQGDTSAAAARVAEGRALVAHTTDPQAHGIVGVADGFTALASGELDSACSRFEEVLESVNDPALRIATMVLLGWALEFRGDIGPALIWQEKALALAESHGESVYREYALWSLGIGWWRHRKPERAEALLKEALHLAHLVDDPRQAAACMQGLGWIASERGDHRRAAVLMAAAETLIRAVGASTVVFPHLIQFHSDCARQVRESLDPNDFKAADEEGRSLGFEDAITYALGLPPSSPTSADPATAVKNV